jgi:hypothetical protein
MALPVRPLVKFVIALSPAALLAVAVADRFFWIGDPGGFVVLLSATWAWLLGVALSADVRSAARAMAGVARRFG